MPGADMEAISMLCSQPHCSSWAAAVPALRYAACMDVLQISTCSQHVQQPGLIAMPWLPIMLFRLCLFCA